jgi:hypothetical protein
VIGRCIHNTGSSLGEPSRGGFYGAGTVFHLELGKDYIVLGLGIFETVLLALVCDETEKPNWLPVGLFEFKSSALPADWEFALLDGAAASGSDASNRWVARWGYAQLVRDDHHSDALVARDVDALAIFFRELQLHSSDAVTTEEE